MSNNLCGLFKGRFSIAICSVKSILILKLANPPALWPRARARSTHPWPAFLKWSWCCAPEISQVGSHKRGIWGSHGMVKRWNGGGFLKGFGGSHDFGGFRWFHDLRDFRVGPPPRVAPMSSLKLTSERKEAILMTVVSLCLDSQLNFFPVSWLSFPSIGETSVGIFLKRPKASQSYCFNRHLAAPDGLIYGSVPTRWHRAKPMRFEHIFTPCIASDLAATKAEKIQESCWGQDEKNLMRICSFSIVGGFERKPQGK